MARVCTSSWPHPDPAFPGAPNGRIALVYRRPEHPRPPWLWRQRVPWTSVARPCRAPPHAPRAA